MRLKYLFAWLLILVMCFALVACDVSMNTPSATDVPSPDVATPSPTDIPKVGNATPLLYKVTDDQGNVTWLFGSIHIGREDYYELPDYVLNAFNASGSLAVEADIVAFETDMIQQTEALSCLIYTDGTNIKDHIPNELYNDAVGVLIALNSYMAILDSYCPMFWSSMIESLILGEDIGMSELGIDRHLLNRAKAAGKEVLEVESAKFQYKMMAEFSDELQAMMLAQSIYSYRNQEEYKADMVELMDLWASGNEEAFEAYMQSDTSDMTDAERALYDEYYKAMFTDRNKFMADYAEAALRSGREIFICVGAAHIVGEGAVAQILAQRGYTVECITK